MATVDFRLLTKINSTAQHVLQMFQLQPILLDLKNGRLLYMHANHICLHHNPFAVLIAIKPDGGTVWEDGVNSQIEVKEEMENVS